MANIDQKNGVFHVRFRYSGKQYKKSLKTRSREDAEMAMKLVERTVHNLLTGVLRVPAAVDPGDYILSGGTLREPRRAQRKVPSLSDLIDEYLNSQVGKADSSVYTERMHLGNLKKKLTSKLNQAADHVEPRDLEQYLRERLKERAAETVKKERTTIVQLFKWAIRQGYLIQSPAADLPKLKGDADRAPFRTIAEINEVLAREGLEDDEKLALWDCLYLNPAEIGGLLKLVRAKAIADFAHLLHVIPAYTGRRSVPLRALRLALVSWGLWERRGRTSGTLRIFTMA